LSKAHDVSQITLFAALYAALVYVFAPVSFNALPIRVAGILGPGIAKKWSLTLGYCLGVIIGGFFSPFAVYEITLMPIMSFLACTLGYLVAKPFNHNYFVTGAVIAIIFPISYGWVLSQVLSLPIILTVTYLFLSDQLFAFAGAVMFSRIEKRFKWWKAQI
jgi:uncharacterized membrane protein